MKTLVLIVLFIILGFSVYLYILGIKSQSGKAPGLVNSQLSRCPATPNCVNSEYGEQDSHYTSPLMYHEKDKVKISVLEKLETIILQSGGKIVKQDANYIAATFTSRLFRFVDDLEIRIDEQQKLIHFRSASRVGRSDLGANKKRVELIKQLYQE